MKHPTPLRFLLCALCLLLPPVRPTAAQAPALTLSQILQRHRDAAATPAARRDTAGREVVYAISAGGLAGTLTTYDAPPHRNRTEMQLGPLSTVTGTDGKVTWEQDGTGGVRILGGEELKERAADAGFSLETFDPIRKSAASEVALRPGLDPATGCYVLDVTPSGGTHQTIYLDPKTFLVRKSIDRKSGLSGVVTMLAYREQDGVQVPSRLSIQYAGLPLVIDARLQSARRLPAPAASLFAPPAPTRDWRFLASGPRVSASLPFQTDSNEIVLPVRVNGHPLRFLLDSGSATAFITGAAADAAGLTTQGSLPALGYGGTASTGLAPGVTLEVGDAVRISPLTLRVIKSQAVTQMLTERGHVDGAVGYELFARLLVGIDYARHLLTLTDPSAPRDAAAALILPLKLENRLPTVSASVDGRAPGRFLVDTGDSGSVHIYTQYAEANQLMPRPGAPGTTTRQGGGVGGAITETLSPGHTLRLGTGLISGLPLATMSGPGIAGLSTNAGGIGNAVLSHFAVTFDYARGQLLLVPNAPAAPAPSPGAAGAQGATSAGPPRLTLAADVDAPQDIRSAPFTLQDLLQRHLAALGGAAALSAIRSTRITSVVQTGGISGTTLTVYAAPDKEFEEDKLGILDNTQGYDGKTAWERDSNGNVRALAGEELKDLRDQLFFDTNSYVLPGRIPGRMSLRPRPEPETGDYIVDAFPQGGKRTTLFFDPQTWMIVREQHLDDDVLVTTAYSDYRALDGTQFPYKTLTTNGTARYDISGAVTKIENNVAAPPALFSEPAGGTNFGFVKPGAVRAAVPFDLEDGEVGFDVRLNGTPERVFLDSGAGGIALSQSAATALGLKSSGFLEVRGYGGSTDQHPVLIHTLEVPGAVRLSDVAAIAVALPEQLDSYFSRPLAGFIGYDLLSHFVVRVDYGHRTLTFVRADAFRPSASDGAALPLNLDSNLPSVRASLDGLPARQFLIDTGDADAAVRLYGPYVAEAGLDKKYPHGELTVGGGIGGLSRARTTRVDSFTVAGVTLRGIPADFSLDTKGGASLVNAGSLGSRLLSRFVITFDYPHGRVFFAPLPSARAAFETRTTGVSLMETRDRQGRPHIAVADILPHAPALQAGLSDFDEVLAIDGRPAAALGLSAARRLLALPSKAPHALRVQSTIGKPRTVTVGLFDPLS